MQAIERHRGLYIVLLGIIGLSLGTLVYLLDRDPEQIYFIYNHGIDLGLYHSFPNLFGSLGNSLPTFIHVFSFILITAALAAGSKRSCQVICLGWLAVDILFEVGQKYKAWALMIIPDWFSYLPYFENSRNYFLYGSFDLNDIGSIFLGAISAYIVLLAITREEQTCRKEKIAEK